MLGENGVVRSLLSLFAKVVIFLSKYDIIKENMYFPFNKISLGGKYESDF